MSTRTDAPHLTQERAVTTVVAFLGVLPILSGCRGIIDGPASIPGGDPTTSSVDSEYRFVNVFWLAAGAGLWWSALSPHKRATTTRAVLGLAAVGGVPRLLSWRSTGRPHPVFQAATALELVGLPAIIAWHRSVFPVTTSVAGQIDGQYQVVAQTQIDIVTADPK